MFGFWRYACLSAVAVAVAGCAVGAYRHYRPLAHFPPTEAEQFMRDLGVTDVSIRCAPNVEDEDGYVACTVSHREPYMHAEAETRLRQIDCPGLFTDASGCRLHRGSW